MKVMDENGDKSWNPEASVKITDINHDSCKRKPSRHVKMVPTKSVTKSADFVMDTKVRDTNNVNIMFWAITICLLIHKRHIKMLWIFTGPVIRWLNTNFVTLFYIALADSDNRWLIKIRVTRSQNTLRISLPCLLKCWNIYWFKVAFVDCFSLSIVDRTRSYVYKDIYLFSVALIAFSVAELCT